MNKQDLRYWSGEIDRFGLLLTGIFIGGLMEATEIKGLAIIFSLAIIIPLLVIDWIIQRKLKDAKRGKSE